MESFNDAHQPTYQHTNCAAPNPSIAATEQPTLIKTINAADTPTNYAIINKAFSTTIHSASKTTNMSALYYPYFPAYPHSFTETLNAAPVSP
jgi:hypothetical protein